MAIFFYVRHFIDYSTKNTLSGILCSLFLTLVKEFAQATKSRVAATAFFEIKGLSNIALPLTGKNSSTFDTLIKNKEKILSPNDFTLCKPRGIKCPLYD